MSQKAKGEENEVIIFRTIRSCRRHITTAKGSLLASKTELFFWPFSDIGIIQRYRIEGQIHTYSGDPLFTANTFDHLICNHFSRKLVQEKWFEKSGSRNLVREKWLTRKKVVLYHKSTFFQVGEKWLTRKKIRVWRTTFLEPLFQKWGRRIKGPLGNRAILAFAKSCKNKQTEIFPLCY